MRDGVQEELRVHGAVGRQLLELVVQEQRHRRKKSNRSEQLSVERTRNSCCQMGGATIHHQHGQVG